VRVLHVLPEAEQELAAAAEWYESKRVGLGVELVASVDRALDEIRDAPLSCALWRSDRPYRHKVLRRFPYVIFFRPDDDAVEVVAFAHAKRSPGYWLSRVRIE
jgi:plasmid stabilization system protein ParE